MAIATKTQNSDDTLRKVNNFLTVAVILLGLFLVVSPILPQLSFWTKRATGQVNDTIPYSKEDEADSNKDSSLPKENRLVIPQMGLDGEVFEGRYASTLNQGIWHRPQTSSPDQGGNTVFVAHRFTYSAPANFYHLDKLKVDDRIAVVWNQKLYNYKVREIKVVEPTAVEIENNTEESILTLYTCTPMWTAEQRLVVVSELLEDG